jgi:hypothetical protein
VGKGGEWAREGKGVGKGNRWCVVHRPLMFVDICASLCICFHTFGPCCTRSTHYPPCEQLLAGVVAGAVAGSVSLVSNTLYLPCEQLLTGVGALFVVRCSVFIVRCPLFVCQ